MIQFSLNVSDYVNYSSKWWKIIIYVIVALVYLGLAYMFYKKCKGKSQEDVDDNYTKVN